jgi:hypothetical protein
MKQMDYKDTPLNLFPNFWDFSYYIILLVETVVRLRVGGLLLNEK